MAATFAASENHHQHLIEALIQHYSSFYKLKKALSWLLRLKKLLRKKSDHSPVKGLISASELQQAEEQVIHFVQGQCYHSEISALQTHGRVPASSSLRKLSPILTNDGLLVIEGRLKHARNSIESKHPFIFPASHKVSEMIALEYHGAAHLGTEWSLSRIRRKYWIIQARNLLKKIKHTCVTCKKLYAPTHHQKIADLPPK